MRLSRNALAISFGLIWGGCLFVLVLINLAAPTYGADFLRGLGSVYPGFYASRTFGDAVLGGVYGLIDGAIAGWLFGWLYNSFATPRQSSGTARLELAA